MPSRNQSGKPEHVFQNSNRKRVKSGKKYEKVFAHCKMLTKRQEKQGETKWIANAWKKVHAKMKKYGITQIMLDAYLSKSK